MLLTLIILLGKLIEHQFWSGGRAVEGGGLENRCRETYRGFESLPLRFTPKGSVVER